MTLSLDDVRRIAHLARIEVEPAALPPLQQQLDSIFGMIDALSRIDTEGVTPMAHAQPVTLPLRDDVVTEQDHRAHYQQGAPAVEDGLYLVPKVIE